MKPLLQSVTETGIALVAVALLAGYGALLVAVLLGYVAP